MAAPAVVDFIQRLAFYAGAGQSLSDVTTKGTSGYNQAAMIPKGDMSRASGPAFPGTPGHFDQGACQP